MYYNQRDFAGIPYPHEEKPNATLKTSGCGAVSISIVVEKLTGDGTFPPPASASFAILCGARENTGTNMRTLAPAIAEAFDLEYQTTSDEDALVDWLKSGGVAIANTGGDRDGYKAIFSTAGHYVVVTGVATDGRLIVQDPDYYDGKYTINKRAARTELHYPDVLVSVADLGKDTANRTPNYYLFKSKRETPSAWARESVAKAVNNGVLIGDEKGNLMLKDPVTREQLCVILDRLGLLD